MICDICGGTLYMQPGATAKCDCCGMDYSTQSLKEKYEAIRKAAIKKEDTAVVLENNDFVQIPEAEAKQVATVYEEASSEAEPETAMPVELPVMNMMQEFVEVQREFEQMAEPENDGIDIKDEKMVPVEESTINPVMEMVGTSVVYEQVAEPEKQEAETYEQVVTPAIEYDSENMFAGSEDAFSCVTSISDYKDQIKVESEPEEKDDLEEFFFNASNASRAIEVKTKWIESGLNALPEYEEMDKFINEKAEFERLYGFSFGVVPEFIKELRKYCENIELNESVRIESHIMNDVSASTPASESMSTPVEVSTNNSVMTKSEEKGALEEFFFNASKVDRAIDVKTKWIEAGLNDLPEYKEMDRLINKKAEFESQYGFSFSIGPELVKELRKCYENIVLEEPIKIESHTMNDVLAGTPVSVSVSAPVDISPNDSVISKPNSKEGNNINNNSDYVSITCPLCGKKPQFYKGQVQPGIIQICPFCGGCFIG